VPVTKKDPYSRDRNLWHLSHEGGPLEDPNFEPEASMFKLTTDPMDAPNEPENVTIGFEAGVPGQRERTAAPAGGAHRHAQRDRRAARRRALDLVENRLIGIKSRGIYETPGGTLLVQALRALESLTLDKESSHEKERLALKYAELVYNGQWFAPLKEAIDAFVDTISQSTTGTATLKLYKGSSIVVGRQSAYSLYSQDLASFDMTGYDASDSAGFIRLFGLPTRGRAVISPIGGGRNKRRNRLRRSAARAEDRIPLETPRSRRLDTADTATFQTTGLDSPGHGFLKVASLTK
jgi:argininosuccinate synthase